MIVKDEERFLDECLSSVKQFVDEIIIIDTGSTDKTVEIAKKHKAKIFSFPWQQDFAAARNFSVEKASGDWILILDADERIAPDDFIKLRSLLTNAKFQGMSLEQRNYTNESSSKGWYPAEGLFAKDFKGYFHSYICRVFQNNPNFRFRYKVHELVEDSILENKGIVVKSPIIIHHYGSSKGKLDKYLGLGLQQIKETPDNAKPYYDVGLIYVEQKKLDLAKAMFEKAASIDENYMFPYTLIGDIYVGEGKLPTAKKYYEKSIKLRNDLNAWLNLGVVYDHQGKDADAAKCFEKVLSLEPRMIQAYNNLFVLLLKTKRYISAWRLLRVAVEKTGLEEFKVKKESFRNKLLVVVEKELKNKPENIELLNFRDALLQG